MSANGSSNVVPLLPSPGSVAATTAPRLVPRFRSFAAMAWVFVVSVSALVLLGWVFDVERLKTLLFRNPVGMNPVTAISFLLCSIALKLKSDERPAGRVYQRWVANGCVAAVVIVGGLVLLWQLGGWDSHVDDWLFRSQLVVRPGRNRMAPNTALNFLLVGLALLFLDFETRRGRQPAQLLTFVAMCVSLVALVGYFLAVLAFYHVPLQVPMAFNTALCFTVLCIGILCSRLDREPMATIVSATAGGVMARRLLPAAFAVPLILGWLRARGEERGLYGPQMGLSLFALGNIVAFNLLVWWTARLLYRIDERRRVVEEQLHRQHLQLEQAAESEHEAHVALKDAQSQLVHSEKMAGLGQMVAGVAHEINNPLAFVSNNVAVLQRDVEAVRDIVILQQEVLTRAAAVLDEAHADLMANIRDRSERIDLPYTLQSLPDLAKSSRNGIKRIQKIVEDLRNFARLDESDMHEVDLNEGIKSTAGIIQPRAMEKGVRIELKLAELPPIACYPAKVNQVVMNLLANAIDASAAGDTISVHTRAEDGNVGIDVVDHGSGIAPAILNRIFDPFFTTKPIGQGTGLGLSVSYRIIKEHGGTITVESVPGQGSRFSLLLPTGSRPTPPVAGGTGPSSAEPH